MHEILLIDKPKGITSYDIIRQLKNQYPRGTKIGHAGTLDPNASGLMIVGIGSGTKKLREFLGLDKTYTAEILLGTQTDSGDITGNILRTKPIMDIDEQRIAEIVKQLVGSIRLPVPKHSSKKIGGTPSHKLVRAGKRPPTILQDMDIRDITLNKHYPENDKYILDLTCTVSSGTYIRSIAEEIGRQLGVPATLKNLRRTHIGTYSVHNAKTL